MQKSRSGSKYGIPSVGLVLGILEHLASSPFQQGITDLSRSLGTTKWRVFRHMHALRESGYVIQDPSTEKFELGTGFYSLTRALPRRFAFADFARPGMIELQRETGHTAVIAALVHDKMILVDAESGAGAPLVVARGKPHDLHASAHGKVALAFGPPELLEGLQEAPLRRYTGQTITDAPQLRRVVARVRTRGWATAFEEGPRSGMNTVCAPILEENSRFAGSIGFIIPGPAKSARSRLFEEDVEVLKRVASDVSLRLGYRPRRKAASA